jgi:precorrin-2/cobalt-factor-2 C20-methyltransferase
VIAATHGAAPRPGRLTGVGVGPGDPGLLTRRALEVLSVVDRVVAPVTAGAGPGRAESVVRAVLPELAISRVAFEMTRDAGRAEAVLADAARALVPWLDAGEHVAFVTLGDPNIYSTFPALLAALAALGHPVTTETVPGITAFQDLASRSGTVLLDGTETLSLVTALDGPDHVAAALADPDRAVVVYKGGRHLPAIAALLAERGRLDGAVLGERLGLADERICPVAEAGEEPASYLATVIVPPAGLR